MKGFWWALALLAIAVFWLSVQLGAAIDDVLGPDEPLRKPE